MWLQLGRAGGFFESRGENSVSIHEENSFRRRGTVILSRRALLLGAVYVSLRQQLRGLVQLQQIKK
jgi:hypothetical protein